MGNLIMNRAIYKVVGRVWETTRGLQCPDLNGRGLLKSRDRKRQTKTEKTHTHTHTHENSVKRAAILGP